MKKMIKTVITLYNVFFFAAFLFFIYALITAEIAEYPGKDNRTFLLAIKFLSVAFISLFMIIHMFDSILFLFS